MLQKLERLGFFICLNILLIFCTLLPSTSSATDSNESIKNLTIFSESNMMKALIEVSNIYSQENNVNISINFNSSFELLEEIDLGEPADIFISSHLAWIEILKHKGLVDIFNVTNIAKDKLILISSKKNNIAINNKNNISKILRTINNKKIPLIVDSQYTSLGRYTNKIISDASIDNYQYVFYKLAEDKKSIVDFIEENSYLGIVLESRVKNNTDITKLYEIKNLDIYYQALVVAGDNMEEARKFLSFLRSDKVKAILRNFYPRT